MMGKDVNTADWKSGLYLAWWIAQKLEEVLFHYLNAVIWFIQVRFPRAKVFHACTAASCKRSPQGSGSPAATVAWLQMSELRENQQKHSLSNTEETEFIVKNFVCIIIICESCFLPPSHR